VSSLSARVEKAARQARDANRRRRLERGEAGWGAPVLPAPVLPVGLGQPRKVVVVGAGRQGWRLAAGTKAVTGAELVGLADLDADRLADIGGRVGLDPEKRFTDAAAMFASGLIDLAAIATTAPHHIALARQAKDAGISRILIEKPIDNDYGEAAKFVAECEADGTLLAVNHSRRWTPDHRSIVAAIHAGQLGDVKIITAQTGAGELAMLGSHHIDFCRMVLRSEPVGVSAQLREREGGNQRGSQYEDPTGHLTVTFASGARAFIDFTDDLDRNNSVVTIRGQEGMIVVEESHETWTMRSASGRQWVFPFADQFRPAPMSARVMGGVLTESVPASSGRDGLAALEVVLAALHSNADGGRVVNLPLTPEQLALPTRFA